jgi:hypothetical protein
MQSLTRSGRDIACVAIRKNHAPCDGARDMHCDGAASDELVRDGPEITK